MGESGSEEAALIQLRFETGPEQIMAQALRNAGVEGWRTQFQVQGVMPTFVWPKKKAALFADDCQRHRCPKHSKRERSAKEENAASKDDQNSRKLTQAGWKVVHTYECEIATPEKAKGIVDFLREAVFKKQRKDQGG